MFPLASASRQARRERLMAERLRRLAEVATEPATAWHGRIITVVTRTPKPGQSAQDDKFNLLDYIRPWWTTVNKVGLRGTILYSGIRPEQVAAATTPLVDLVEIHPGGRHVFHERHFLIREFLRSIDDPYIFLTDASDVAFKRDPFPIVLSRRGKSTLFVGREKRRIIGSKCIRNEMRQQFGQVLFPFRPVLNPGILGGSREAVLRALDRVTNLILEYDGRLIASDMCLFNRALYESFLQDEIFTGLPLHSVFKGWEFDTSAAILHK